MFGGGKLTFHSNTTFTKTITAATRLIHHKHTFKWTNKNHLNANIEIQIHTCEREKEGNSQKKPRKHNERGTRILPLHSGINDEIKNKKAEWGKEKPTTTTTSKSIAYQSQAIIETVKKFTSFGCSCHFFSIHFSFQFRVTFITIFIFHVVCECVCRLSSSLNRNYPPSLAVYFIFTIPYIRKYFMLWVLYINPWTRSHTHTNTHRTKFVPYNLKRFL